jgi:hypothetical protein
MMPPTNPRLKECSPAESSERQFLMTTDPEAIKDARTKVGRSVGTSLGFRVQEVLPRTKGEYYRLVLVVGPARAGKTLALNDLSKRRGWPRLNVNLLLSEKLLDLTQRSGRSARRWRLASLSEYANPAN